jgi:xanthine dehydrogenase YagS FAD-binding subunit
MDRFAYIQPATPQAVIAALANHPQAVLKAGGVDLLDLMKERILAPPTIVDISQVAEWSQLTIDPDSGALHLGALVTLAQIAANTNVQTHWPGLSQATASAATPQIRNMATLGGNLCQRPRCWYFRQEAYPCRKKGGDTCFAQLGENRHHAIFANYTCTSTHPSAAAIPLLAYDARLHILDKTGAERDLPLSQFFLDPERDVQREHVLSQDEILTAIVVPRLPEGAGSAYLNFKHKLSFDWPSVEVAVVLHWERLVVRDARIVIGSVAPVPLRLHAAEHVLEGNAIDADIAHQAGQDATRGATPLAHNAYKVPLLAELVRRTVLKAAGQLPEEDEVMAV